ncbi:LysR family transcriptional regulator [Caulobacter segnis]|uniref:LysR family transcriptional regulator n=1 Tax=Caulobacter segnis TaxID=88688 RepID=UPI00240FD7D2|nr:LysR family transcriptional regulator [Caulobacter segnis]MDG2520618.1 LysR family transcriptional regulator [Caulobacter segnis]
MDTLSWDDLRIVKAVAIAGTVAAAAQTLSLNVSTIVRRLSNIEEALGVALFDRRRTGYVPTVQGEEVIALAGRMELDVVSVTRRVSGHAHAGDLRITTSDSILLYFLTPMIASFKARNPAVRVEVSVGNGALNLARGEADIAVRATDTPPENLFGRKVANIAWCAYTARSSSGLAASDDRLSGARAWVSYGGRLSALRACRLLDSRVPADAIGYRTDSVAGAAAAIAAGLGAGYLPCMLGDLSPDLQRIGPLEPELDDHLWLLTHPDIRRSGRVFAFMNHCVEAIGRQRDLVEGRRGDILGASAPDLLRRALSFPAGSL